MNYKEFFDTLPVWDGEDRVAKLQQLVKIKAMHLPPRGKKSNEVDWFNFLVRQVIMSGKANCVIAGDKVEELIAYLFSFVDELKEEIASRTLCINEGVISITDINLLHIIMQMPHCKWIIAMEIKTIDDDYKRLDMRQLYAQILNKPKQSC